MHIVDTTPVGPAPQRPVGDVTRRADPDAPESSDPADLGE